MRTHSLTCQSQRGSTLLLTLVLTAVAGFALASYLSLVNAQRRSVVRSQTWNATIPLIEAGIEEAMAHLNENGLTNLYSQGWKSEYGLAVRRRNLGDGRYTVAISPTTRPVIECTGYIPAPISFADLGQTFFAQAGSTISLGKKYYVHRTVRVTTGGGALFAMGMVAKGRINFNGNNVSTDSFDSADPNFSTNGRYNRALRKDRGDVATNSKEPNLFNAGNANIMGRVGTGPGGNISLGPNGTVGSYAWVTTGKTGIEPGYFADDMNLSFPDVEQPFSWGFTPAGGNVSETNFSFGTGLVTVVTLPSPMPAGPITTNYGLTTTRELPSPLPAGAIITNFFLETSTAYPSTPIGPVTTNTMVVMTNSLPSPIPPEIIRVVTNLITVTNLTLPSPTPAGTIITNTVFASLRYPYSPMPNGPPADPPSWVPPAPGTYVGVVTNRYVSTGKSSERGWYHDYRAIQSYVFQALNYAVTYAASYTYTNVNYTLNVPQSYTYQTITSTNVTVTTDYYDVVLDSRDYVTTLLTGNVYVRGRARILVTDSIKFTGHDGITIGPGGSLIIYMKGASAQIAGRGMVNKTGQARNFLYYGLNTHTQLDLSGNGEFVGCIYAPYANFFLRGGGNNTEDFIGASITSTVSMNGHFNFHYDEDLSRSGPKSRYTVNSWNEIGPNETKLLKNPEWVFLEDYFD